MEAALLRNEASASKEVAKLKADLNEVRRLLKIKEHEVEASHTLSLSAAGLPKPIPTPTRGTSEPLLNVLSEWDRSGEGLQRATSASSTRSAASAPGASSSGVHILARPEQKKRGLLKRLKLRR
jgi:hypothetical protein